jgi:hypothetical protein
MSIFNRSSTLKQFRPWFYKNHTVSDRLFDLFFWIVGFFSQDFHQQNFALNGHIDHLDCYRHCTLLETTLSEGMEYCHAA